MIRSLLQQSQKLKLAISNFDFLSPLLFRLILAPTMIIAGFNKLNLGNTDVSLFSRLLADESVVTWFGNTEWGLGLPFPDLLAFLAGWTEFLGGWLLLLGLFTRLVSIPLIFTMLVAITSVHWHNGWFAIAPSSGDASPATVLNWFNIEAAQQSLENSNEVSQRLTKINEIIETHGFPGYLLEKGSVAILNNGIEFAAIYLAMLLSLLFTGAGRFVSLDYWIFKRFH
ncbi:quinol oxidase [Pseudoalteromonas phenolica]|uniref:Quinol oxidase n=1 Tax=Pseudoalteromonas phenolica TaxID=161398 RepID=A0A5S3YRT0_9GAMM|nr:DoxX family protein [Pseudoalteromonas phenolica]TMP78896.1 quinol oxidase [Pseudoalteromonas phenolica]